MGSLALVFSVIAVVFFIAYTDAAGSCPLASKVYGCSPKCQQAYDCSHGRQCCPNSCNTKSCVDVAEYGGGNSGSDKYKSSGAGIYCGNQKCSPFEVCKQDPSTRKMKCSRA